MNNEVKVESEKKSKLPLIIIIIGLLIIVGSLVCHFVLGGNETKKEQKEEPKQEEKKEEHKQTNPYEKDCIRKTELVLVEEPACSGKTASLTASINKDKNISIVQGDEKGTIVVGNAKYIYSVGILACDSVRLYFITEDNELYYVPVPNTSSDAQKGVLVTDTKIIEFLGTETKEDGQYLKVLNKDYEIEYINYFETSN